MKLFKYLITIAVVAIVIFVATKNTPITHQVNTNTLGVLPTEMKESCYIWNTEVGDSATLRIKYKIDNPEIVGLFDWSPVGKNRKTGTFTGAADGDGEDGVGYYTAWWKSSGEESTKIEEIRIVDSISGQAAVAFGEMKDSGDGVFVYADPEHLSYEPSLTLTDCSDPAVYK